MVYFCCDTYSFWRHPFSIRRWTNVFPWAIGDLPTESNGRSPLELMTAYLLLTITFIGWSFWLRRQQNHSSPYAPAIGVPPGEPPNADVPAAESEGPALPAN